MTVPQSIVFSNAVRNANGDFLCSRKPGCAEGAFAVACAALVVYEYCEETSGFLVIRTSSDRISGPVLQLDNEVSTFTGLTSLLMEVTQVELFWVCNTS